MTTRQILNPDVIVIGAGSAGMAAAHAIWSIGYKVKILEQADRPGESWRHRHPQLRLNTHRYLSGLPGMKMPRSGGPFPDRDTVISFLEDYARFIRVPIHYGTTVTDISRQNNGWRISTDKGDDFTRHVVIATGYDRIPHIPHWEGMDSFTGEIRHAADFGDLRYYQGKRVLVVGAGNSGTDILNHLATVNTEQTWVSVRHGPTIFPTRLYGIPIQLLSPMLAGLPATWVDRMLKLTERLAFGKLERLGLPQHTAGGATRLLTEGTAPAIDNGFIASLKAGRVTVVPRIMRINGDKVSLDYGSCIKPDVIICATGYRTGLDQILAIPEILNKRGTPRIHGAEQASDYLGLWFTGMRPRLTGYFQAAGETGQAIANAIKAQTPLPLKIQEFHSR